MIEDSQYKINTFYFIPLARLDSGGGGTPEPSNSNNLWIEYAIATLSKPKGSFEIIERDVSEPAARKACGICQVIPPVKKGSWS